MGRLSLMMFSLAVLLFAANSLPPVNEALLEDLVPQTLNHCLGQRKTPMFSLAVRIPFNSENNIYDISQFRDTANEIQNKISNCEVYTGTRVVAATAIPHGEHAEYRTLRNLKTMLNNRNIGDDLLLIYVYASQCSTKCAKIGNKGILDLLKGYKKYKPVFVFSKVFQPRDIQPDSPENLQVALTNLGEAIGLDRIFRCDYVKRIMKCVNCNSNGNVAGWCYDDNQPPA